MANCTKSYDIAVPAGTSFLRVQTLDDGDADDIDMYVYRVVTTPTPGLVLVGQSATATSAEVVSLVNPTAATYRVFIHGFATDGPTADYTLHSWVLGTADEGNMNVTAPATAVTDTTGAIQLTFTGLDPATKYLGSVAYSTTPPVAGFPNPTIVHVDTP